MMRETRTKVPALVLSAVAAVVPSKGSAGKPDSGNQSLWDDIVTSAIVQAAKSDAQAFGSGKVVIFLFDIKDLTGNDPDHDDWEEAIDRSVYTKTNELRSTKKIARNLYFIAKYGDRWWLRALDLSVHDVLKQVGRALTYAPESASALRMDMEGVLAVAQQKLVEAGNTTESYAGVRIPNCLSVVLATGTYDPSGAASWAIAEVKVKHGSVAPAYYSMERSHPDMIKEIILGQDKYFAGANCGGVSLPTAPNGKPTARTNDLDNTKSADRQVDCAKLETGFAPGCEACIQASCCSQALDCAASPSCKGLVGCLKQNCGEAASAEACAALKCTAFLGGADLAKAAQECVQRSCQATCS